MSQSASDFRGQVKLIGVALLGIVVLAIIAAALVYATEIFLILFLGVLFGVFLSKLGLLASNYLNISYGGGVGLVVVTFLGLTAGVITLFGSQIENQVERAQENADEGAEKLRELLGHYPNIESALQSTPFLGELIEVGASEEGPSQKEASKKGGDEEKGSEKGSSEKGDRKKGDRGEKTDSNASDDKDDASQEDPNQLSETEQQALKDTAQRGMKAVSGIFKTTFGLVVNSALIFFVGLFLAISPTEYRDGLVRLLPESHRARAREIADLMGDALWHWLIGTFGSMLITGAGAGLLLALLGVPMAVTLGILTALLTFIPNIGSAIALVLAVLFALSKGGTVVLLVIVGYIGLQLMESYIVTPLIQQKQVSLPPALLIAFQAVMGVIFGFLGAAVASPMLAAAKVGIEEAYIKDILEAGASESPAE